MRTVTVKDGMLTCSRCGITKPTNEFSKGHNKSGYRSNCKQCVHEMYLADKERILQQHKDYYENNKESYLDNCKQYRDAHREERREYFKDYYLENAEHLKEKSHERFHNRTEEQREAQRVKARQRRKTDEYRAYSRQKRQYRNSLIRNLPSDYTKEEWQRVILFFDGACAYCGKEKKLTQDHIIPAVRGGGYTKSNIVPCCASCNSSKQDRDYEEWFKNKSFFNEKRLKKIKEVMQWQ